MSMKKKIFARLIFAFMISFNPVSAFSQVPKETRPDIPRPIGCFDVKSGMSDEEIMVMRLEEIANNELFDDDLLDEKPQPVLSTTTAKKAKSNYISNLAIKKIKALGINIIAKITIEKDGTVSEVNVFQTDAPEIKKDKEVKSICCIFGNASDSQWRELKLKSHEYLYAWVSQNQSVNKAVSLYINSLKWTIGRLYDQATRTELYYVLP